MCSMRGSHTMYTRCMDVFSPSGRKAPEAARTSSNWRGWEVTPPQSSSSRAVLRQPLRPPCLVGEDRDVATAHASTRLSKVRFEKLRFFEGVFGGIAQMPYQEGLRFQRVAASMLSQNGYRRDGEDDGDDERLGGARMGTMMKDMLMRVFFDRSVRGAIPCHEKRCPDKTGRCEPRSD